MKSEAGTGNGERGTVGAALAPRPTLAAVLASMLLAGCALVGGEKEPVSIYAPVVQVAADPAWPVAQWQLGIPKVHAGGMLESRRIAVQPVPGELQVYKGALWASEPAEQLRDAVLRTLEDSDKIAAVARQESGIASDYRLELDLRRYEADYAGAPSPAALVEVHAKLVRSIGREVVAEQTFREAVPAQGADVAQVAQAFGIALGGVAGDIAGWTLRSGKSL